MPVATGKAVTILTPVTAAFLLLTIAVVAIKQFAGRNPGRAWAV